MMGVKQPPALHPEEDIGCTYPILLRMKQEKLRLWVAAHDAYREMRAHRDNPDSDRFDRAIWSLGSAILDDRE